MPPARGTSKRKTDPLLHCAIWLILVAVCLWGSRPPADGGITRKTLRASVSDATFTVEGQCVVFAPAVVFSQPEPVTSARESAKTAAGTVLLTRADGSSLTAPRDGTFVRVCDGWEDLWDREDCLSLSPDDFAEKLTQKTQAPATADGKLITSPWLYAGLIMENAPEEAGEGKALPRPTPGQPCTLTLAGKDIPARTERWERGDEYTLWLMRLQCPATQPLPRFSDAVGQTSHGKAIILPAAAVMTGDGGERLVLTRRGHMAYARPVTVLWEEGGQAFLSPAAQTLRVGDEKRRTLLAGDIVILSPEGLSDKAPLYSPANETVRDRANRLLNAWKKHGKTRK